MPLLYGSQHAPGEAGEIAEGIQAQRDAQGHAVLSGTELGLVHLLVAASWMISFPMKRMQEEERG